MTRFTRGLQTVLWRAWCVNFNIPKGTEKIGNLPVE
jgi:hypothetical protein